MFELFSKDMDGSVTADNLTLLKIMIDDHDHKNFDLKPLIFPQGCDSFSIFYSCMCYSVVMCKMLISVSMYFDV